MINFSVNNLVQDLEEVFIKNFDSKEKVESMEQVFTDFLLLRKLYSKFQTNPQSLIQTGLQLLKKTNFSITLSFLFQYLILISSHFLSILKHL